MRADKEKRELKDLPGSPDDPRRASLQVIFNSWTEKNLHHLLEIHSNKSKFRLKISKCQHSDRHAQTNLWTNPRNLMEVREGQSQINLTSLIKKTTKLHHPTTLQRLRESGGELWSLIMQKMQNYHPLNEFKIRKNPFGMGRNDSPRQLKFLLQLQRTINYSNRSRHSARSLTLSPLLNFMLPSQLKVWRTRRNFVES